MSDKSNISQIHPDIPRLGNSFSEWLGKVVLNSLGWKITGTFPACKKMVIAVAPHTSNWDFVIGIAVVFRLRLKISFMGKHSIFVPPFDRLLRRWGGIPIERSKSHGVVEQLSDAMKSSDKMILAVAPEGTRSKIDNWKTGFLHIAHKADVPVMLVALDYQKKEVQLGHLMHVNGSVDESLQEVYQFYATVPAKYPENVACPGAEICSEAMEKKFEK